MLLLFLGATVLAVDTTAQRRPAPAASIDTVGQPAGKIYDGRSGQINVRIPMIKADVPVDGTLTGAPWQQAAVLTGFSEYQPVDGAPATDSTEVLVWYSPTAIYFGIRAFEAHGAAHATLANRDKIDADDNVQIVLTPFVHGRNAIVLSVNPYGIQEDGTITEGVTASGYGATSQTGLPLVDLSADFVFESKGVVTPFGYEVVVRVPFRSIKYQSTDPQDWGINIVRTVQHTGEKDTWVPAELAAASFLAQSGTIVGLTGLEHTLVLDFNPFVTETLLGGPTYNPNPSWQYGVARPQFGANLRWGITNNLILDATYRPDFAEVESDATQLVFDPRNAIQYPEKRPFFLDGIEQFSAPNTLIYTRQIQAPLGAVKLTGKIGGINVAYLGAQDAPSSTSAGAIGHPLFNVLRVLGDVGAASQIGAVVSDVESQGSFSRLAALDTRFIFDKIYSLSFQGGASSSSEVIPPLAGSPPGTPATVNTAAGPLWEAHFIRGGRTFGLNYDILGIDPEFVAAAGFITRTGVVNVNLDNRITFYNPPAAFLQTYGGEIHLVGIWRYRDFTSGLSAEDTKIYFLTTATLRGGWQLSAQISPQHFGYDPALYANYYLGHISGADTTYTPFVGTPTIPNTDYTLTLATPQFSRFYGSLAYIWGRDENYYEWSSADIGITELTIDWRPTDKLRTEFTYNAQIYHRHSDGSLVAQTRIPRLSIEYQLAPPLFVRLVGQYDAAYQDSLRDDSRTNLPIFLRNATTGVLTRASAMITNQVQGSFLFSYQPLPGTVAFVGYGNNLTEPQSFHFTTLTRTSDSFFVKLSYLFRL